MDFNTLDSKNDNWNPLAEDVDIGETLLHILEEVRSLKDKFDKCNEEKKELIETLKIEIQDLKQEVRELNPHKEPQFKLLPKLPFDSMTEMKEFDEQLPTNDEMRAELKKFLYRLGGKDFVAFLKASLRAVVTDELAINLTWRGTTEKPSIQSFNLFVILRDTCHAKFESADLTDINRICQQHFLHAKDRAIKKKPSASAPIASFIPSVTPPIKREATPVIVEPPSPPSSILPRLPFNTLSSLEEFDDKLLDDNKLKKALKHYISKVGGKDHSSFLRSAFRAVMSDEVAMELTWRGTKEKQSIQEFTVFIIIRNACYARYTEVNNSDISKVCQQHFLHARDRVNKRTKLS